jgi:hypothetical protein
MKKIFFSLILLLSTYSWAEKTIIDFNKEINNDVNREISKDEERFKKKITRLPASVPEVDERVPLKEPLKLDKNLRQIGPNEW